MSSTPLAAPWPPYTPISDCSLGFCSIYCPQWCYFFLPPPPPSSHSPFSLSPLLIALIILLSSAFLIVTAYIFALKYFTHRRRHRFPAAPSTSIWLPPPPSGLDSSLINKLTTYRHRASANPSSAGETDCPVCLAEFRDGETIRLLPKCAHAFHRSCIDTWLSSHSNCPLCRAGILPPAEIRTADIEAGESATAPYSPEVGRRVDDVAIEIVEERDEVGVAAESSAGGSAGPAKSSVSSGRGSDGVVLS